MMSRIHHTRNDRNQRYSEWTVFEGTAAITSGNMSHIEWQKPVAFRIPLVPAEQVIGPIRCHVSDSINNVLGILTHWYQSWNLLLQREELYVSEQTNYGLGAKRLNSEQPIFLISSRRLQRRPVTNAGVQMKKYLYFFYFISSSLQSLKSRQKSWKSSIFRGIQ